jgi:ATP-dependent Clp protease protease subunit
LRKNNNLDANKKLSEFSTYIDDAYAKRIILIDREITEESCSEWVTRLILLDLQTAASKKPIILLINSYGGDMHAALGLSDIIKNCKAPVHTICIGVAQSAGSILLASGKKRYTVPNAEIMMHCHFAPSEENLTHYQLVNATEASTKSINQLIQFYIDNTTMTKKKIIECLKKDTFLTSDQALEFGLVDEVGWDLLWMK